MTHRRTPQADSDLDGIWRYIAVQSGSYEIADRLHRRSLSLARHPSPHWARPRRRPSSRSQKLSSRRLHHPLSHPGPSRTGPSRPARQQKHSRIVQTLTNSFESRHPASSVRRRPLYVVNHENIDGSSARYQLQPGAPFIAALSRRVTKNDQFSVGIF